MFATAALQPACRWSEAGRLASNLRSNLFQWKKSLGAATVWKNLPPIKTNVLAEKEPSTICCNGLGSYYCCCSRGLLTGKHTEDGEEFFLTLPSSVERYLH